VGERPAASDSPVARYLRAMDVQFRTKVNATGGRGYLHRSPIPSLLRSSATSRLHERRESRSRLIRLVGEEEYLETLAALPVLAASRGVRFPRAGICSSNQASQVGLAHRLCLQLDSRPPGRRPQENQPSPVLEDNGCARL
jgi:hypothetical protein